jgi:hypothetical protein
MSSLSPQCSKNERLPLATKLAILAATKEDARGQERLFILRAETGDAHSHAESATLEIFH